MRLIDADALVEKIESEIYRYWNGDGGGYYLAEDAVKEVEAAPTVDAERHGKWVAQDTSRVKFMCSECNARNYGGHENYCPHCGAKMDGD